MKEGGYVRKPWARSWKLTGSFEGGGKRELLDPRSQRPAVIMIQEISCGVSPFRPRHCRGETGGIYREKGAEGSRAKQRALARKDEEVAFYQGKVASAVYFAAAVLPTIQGRCRGIGLGDRTPIEMLEASF
jgi:hypothetical protein